MIDYNELGSDGEKWELFARDFFEKMGFSVESSPDRGADGGKDLLLLETMRGHLSSHKFRWLVSCKNYVTSNRAVNESKDEQNILERCKSFEADGFIGFYSTIASSGLNARLMQLKANGELKDFKIFDGKLIEDIIINHGWSNLLLRYFPESYQKIRPLHKLYSDFLELKCRRCGRDLFSDIENGVQNAIIAWAEKITDKKSFVDECYVVCKGECDRWFEKKFAQCGYTVTWDDLTDLANPLKYLHYIMCLLDKLHESDHYSYSDKALKMEKYLLAALGQKVFHEVTESERQSFQEMFKWGLW